MKQLTLWLWIKQSVRLQFLYEEDRWAILGLHRSEHKFITFYKKFHGIVPLYLQDLLPHLVSETSVYNLRNNNDILQPMFRLEIRNKIMFALNNHSGESITQLRN